ncbi:hypothetical protein [Cellulomonas sp. IC4_254]|uniref:hypothetical protein n=1 Tax=Cellulomonas sp. IC4_254 TaxID=2714040 RepID=UPI001423384F|nr:hypothetical protein [Cellulomonas sp. IC4_254]NHT17771.1 hypothetical protein [Cellulomonas sp. IC4_254]
MNWIWQLGTESAWERADWLSFAQLVFTALGFGLAWIQLRRSANAAEESKRLLEQMQSRAIANDLLLMLPNLHKLEDELDAAVKSGDADAAERALVSYSRLASEVAEMLRGKMQPDDVALADLLVQSVAAARRAKTELTQGPKRPLVEIVKISRVKIGKASVSVSAAVARIQREINDHE